MTAVSVRTITLDSKALNGAIEALAQAVEGFGLTRRERIVYRALMISVDFAIVSFVIYSFALFWILFEYSGGLTGISLGVLEWFVLLAVTSLGVSIVAGCASLLLNIPLLRRTMRQRTRLKALGLTPLSKSLWRASPRRRWISGPRSALLTVICGLSFFTIFGRERRIAAWLAAFATTLLVARYYRNQREQIDVATNADRLKNALQSLREQARGKGGTIEVPAELVEQAAKIESAHIAKQRQDAILQSPPSHLSGYSVAFDEAAARQRAELNVANRLDLEDLLVQLSTGDPQTAPPSANAGGQRLRRTTDSGHVEIEYVVDTEHHAIRILAVKGRQDGPLGRSAGASYG